MPTGQLAAWLVVLAIAVAGIEYWVRLLDDQQLARAALSQQEEMRARQLSLAVEQQVDATLRGIDVASRNLRSIYISNRSGFDAAAREMISAYPPKMLQFVTVFSPDGHIAYSTEHAREGLYFGDREHFRVPAADPADQLFISRPIIGRITAIPLIQLTRAIRSRGRLLGVVGMPMRPEFLIGELDNLRMAPGDVFAVQRLDGTFLARAPVDTATAGQPQEKQLATRATLPPGSSRPGDAGLIRVPTPEGATRIVSWRWLHNWPLVASVTVDETAALADLTLSQHRERMRAAWTLAGTALATTLLMTMVWLQRRQQRRLAESERLHRHLFEGSKSPIILVDSAEKRLVGANSAAVAFYGYPADELLGMPISRINQLSDDEIAREMQQAVNEQRDFFRFPHRLANGDVREVEVHTAPVEINGRVVLHSIVHDATERLALERRVSADSKRLAALLATATDGIHVMDTTGRLLEYSESFALMLGMGGRSLHGMTVFDWDMGITRERLTAMLADLASGQSLRFETQHRRADGSTFEAEVLARGFSIDGEAFVYSSSRDISDRKRTERELRIAAIAFEAQEGMIVTDAEGRVQHVNQAFTRITGYARDEVVGRNPSVLQSGSHDQDFYREMWRSIAAHDSWEGEIWNRRKSGETYPEWLSIKAVRDDKGQVVNYVGALADITQRKRDEQEIRQLAFFDTLTQLPNRRHLLDRLEQTLAAARRSGHAVGLLFIDLDNFKSVNDTLGHEVGDELLRQVARRLLECARKEDTVARLGGDEFVMLLDALAPTPREAAASIESVARRCLSDLNREFEIHEFRLQTSPSIGATICFEGESQASEILKQADIAMYQSKLAGRNTLRFFDTAMQAAIDEQARYERELRQALKAGEFSLAYQPQVRSDGTIVGVEALARWLRPGQEPVPPVEFIRLAERIGAIHELGHVLLGLACAQQAAWQADPVKSRLTVAVNISAIQFQQPSFVEQTLATIRAAGANPSRIKLELTESLLLADAEENVAKIKALASHGIEFSIDDFGTGYSSLSYLKRLPLRQLKIDRSFVADLPSDTDALAIASMIIALARQLRFDVIAEGVERLEQVECLAGIGCPSFQGFYFSQPLTPDAVDRLMAAGVTLPA